MADVAEYEAIRNQYRSHRGHFTARSALAQRYFEANRAVVGPDAALDDRIRFHLQRIQESFDRCTDLLELVFDLQHVAGDDVRRREWEQRRAVLLDVMLPLEADLQALLNRRPPAPAVPVAPAAAPAAAPPATRANVALRPFLLTSGHSIPELDTWMDLFRAYHTSSRMDLSTVPEQQAYFKVCLDSGLWNRIKHNLTDQTPLFGQVDSCEAYLRDEFDLIYPLFTRRLDFLRFSQSPGEPWHSWLDKVLDKRDCAQLDTLTVAELVVFSVINNTSDAKLRERFLRLRHPTLEDLRQCAQLHSQALLISKGIDASKGASVSVNAVRSSADVTARAARPAPSAAPSGSGSLARLPPRRSCPDCLSKHQRSVCRFRNSTCHTCGKTGHISDVCFQKKKSASVNVVMDPAAGASLDLPAPPLGKATPRIRVTFSSPSSLGSGHTVSCLPDTGTASTVLSLACAVASGLQLLPLRSGLCSANGSPLNCRGYAVARMRFGDSFVDSSVYVMDDLVEHALIGYNDLVALGWNLSSPSLVRHSSQSLHSSINSILEPFEDSLDAVKKDFGDVFSDVLKHQMSGPPAHINLRPGPVSPTRTLTARPIPLHWQAEAAKVVKDALDAGIIVKIPDSEPTDWISPAFFVPKEGGRAGVRLVTDYTNLNRFVSRPIHTFPSAQDIMRHIPSEAKFFCKLDCTSGYFQVPLDLESSYLTTFLLPSGRYRYTGTPMGLNASSDFWCHRSDRALLGLQWLQKIVDDILIWAPTLPVLFHRLRVVLQRCRESGITISLRKVRIGSSIPFAGFLVSESGISPDPSLLSSIKDFPRPTNLTNLRSYLGLANQLGSFLPDLTHLLTPLRSLLKKDVVFQWLPDHESAFVRSKALLVSPPVLRPFEPGLPTLLVTDASRLYGFGFALFQTCSDRLRLVCCGSCSLSSAQRNYSTIELESAAIKWAVSKCNFYLKGHPGFDVITDHRPLLGIYSKPLSEISNPRLLSNREHLAGYSFNLVWQPGKLNAIADALSRNPLFDPPSESCSSLCCAISDDPLLQPFRLGSDDSLAGIIQALQAGVMAKNLPPQHPGRELQSYWDRLSVKEGLLLLDSQRIFVPFSQRARVLALLHRSHAGVTKTLAHARALYFWPGMTNSVKQMVQTCSACISLLPSQAHYPFRPSMAPTGPFSDVGVDLFYHGGQHYLCLVDSFSGYPLVHQLRSLSSSAILKRLNEWFLVYGYPERLRSDNGPQFRTEFSSWCLSHGILHQTSSPYHPASNGLAESAVKSVKKVLKASLASGEPFLPALAAFRATPREDGFSPNHLLFGRDLRSQLPALPCAPSSLPKAREQLRDRPFLYANQHTRDLPPLPRGSPVVIQDPKSGSWSTTGTVLEPVGRHSYSVSTESGVFVRNRTFLRPIHSASYP